MGYLLWIICTWESLALALQRFSVDRLPTISQVLGPHRDSPWVAMIVGAFSAWLYWHILVEGR